MFDIKGKYTTAKVYANQAEPECMSQIYSFVNHPAFTNPVAIMPDTHYGKGCVIGFTMLLTDKVVPNVVGVDIGCGMLSINLGKVNVDFEKLDNEIRGMIPTGHSIHDLPVVDMVKKFPWGLVTIAQRKVKSGLPDFDYGAFQRLCVKVGIPLAYAECSIGTLGGGNHFIEGGRSQESGELWITIHSGSRNLGKRICEYWQRKAEVCLKLGQGNDLKSEIEKIKAAYRGKDIETKINELRMKLNTSVSSDLAWLEGEDAKGYMADMLMAQVYAHVNRATMGAMILDIINNRMGLKINPRDRIETIHNFIDPRDMIIRKGAIRAYAGERMIIPFNMRDGLAICEGKSNNGWNYSAPHGAGRLMSRKKAKQTVDLETFKQQMAGIYSTSVCRGTLEEAPDAYKDTREILDLIEPTATVLEMVKPVYNLKDTSIDGRPEEKLAQAGPGF